MAITHGGGRELTDHIIPVFKANGIGHSFMIRLLKSPVPNTRRTKEDDLIVLIGKIVF
jgi:hypothetical protein